MNAEINKPKTEIESLLHEVLLVLGNPLTTTERHLISKIRKYLQNAESIKPKEK